MLYAIGYKKRGNMFLIHSPFRIFAVTCEYMLALVLKNIETSFIFLTRLFVYLSINC